ncbi:unnamed protein product [Brachionus calyciflorus]|uniref:Uncharacterized protein n=1 Tax=Brachionus calyciflorus TaxID=104777 RepID=A0A813P5A5_9BILA|nr:unnamed protein product [Brachionus calyciflorus]
MKIVRPVILICIKLYFFKCSSLFQLYKKSFNGPIYVVSNDFKIKNSLPNLKSNTLLKCLRKCDHIKECILIFINRNSKFMNDCEFYSNVPMRVSQIYQTSSTNESQLIYFKKGFEIKTFKYGSNHSRHLIPTHSLRLRQGNQLNVEYLDIYYDWEKIRGYKAYFFNGTTMPIGTTNINKLQIDLKNKTKNKIAIRANSTLVNQLQFCWISQIDFSNSCSLAVGGTGGKNYTFYYDSTFKQFQFEHIIVSK